jgi:tripartite-type tricarboxylate transporter receptor subunit TctC
MKKLLIIFSLIWCTTVSSKEVVPIVWAFAPYSNQANALRVIIDNANNIQEKYTFIFESKPGAGGSIAVNHVINQKKLTLLMISSSVFVRPIYYPNESYDINQLQPIAITSIQSTTALKSKNYSSLEELKKQKSFTIGIVYGTMSEIVARVLQKELSPIEIVFVPYQGTVDATLAVLGGHIDTALEFLGDSNDYTKSGTLKVLGITGTKNIEEWKTFSSLGIKGAENIVGNYQIITNKSVNTETIKEMNEIFNEAISQQNVKNVWKNDYATVPKMNYKEVVNFWESQKYFWNKIQK